MAVLANNDLNTFGVLILAPLKSIKHLKTLAPSNNFMSHDLVTKLAATEFISNNPLLTEVWLGGNML